MPERHAAFAAGCLDFAPTRRPAAQRPSGPGPLDKTPCERLRHDTRKSLQGLDLCCPGYERFVGVLDPVLGQGLDWIAKRDKSRCRALSEVVGAG